MAQTSLAAQLIDQAGLSDLAIVLDWATSSAIERWMRLVIESISQRGAPAANVESLFGENLSTALGAVLGVDGFDDEVLALWLGFDGGVRIKAKDFVSSVESLWYPSRDDVLLLSTNSDSVALLDHEERLWLSRWSSVRLDP
jgi:hypothetical protein